MQQLSGLDAAFLELETGDTHAHVGCVCVLADDALSADRLRALVRSRTATVPVFGRRLVTVPGGLDHPWWVPDPIHDLTHHVRELPLPPGAGSADRRLADLVAGLHAEPLERSRPLWAMTLVTGLPGGRRALYLKVHHAALDGIAVGDVVSSLSDAAADARTRDAGPGSGSAPVTGSGGGRTADAPRLGETSLRTARLLATAAANAVRRPLRVARVAVRLARTAPGVAATLRPLLPRPGARGVVPLARRLLAGQVGAPPTPFNAPITAARACAFAELPLTDIDAVRRSGGLTVTDVVAALIAGALRRWLLEREALPSRPLVAAVPVSSRRTPSAGSRRRRSDALGAAGRRGPSGAPVSAGRRPSGAPAAGNELSFLLTALPTTTADPQERLAAAHAFLERAKAGHAAIPVGLVADLTQLTPPWLGAAEWRLLQGLRALQRGFNLVLSTIPGPAEPFSLGGSEVVSWFPVSAVADGQGLNLTVLTYRGVAYAGLLAAPELVPDVAVLAGYLRDELSLAVATVTG